MAERRPSFSIILETANLSQQADASDLFRVLDTLDTQTPHPREANECLLVQCGTVSPEAIERVRTAYPWVTVVVAPSGTGYYASKMVGARAATGEVAVLCDSDCRYGTGWLAALLEPFIGRPDVHAVAGNTGLAMTNPFSLGLGMIWPFPMFSLGARRGLITFYAANNVAFRRETLLAHPLPPDTPVYRGNCAVQSTRMRREGLKIHFARTARSIHPLPASSPSVFFWRFLLSGHDWLVWHRFATGRRAGFAGVWRDAATFGRTALRWAARPWLKTPMLVREEPVRLLWLPVALPVAGAAWVLFCLGFLISAIRPQFLMTVAAPRMEH